MSTNAIGRTDKVMDILKEHVPEEKIDNAVDALCARLDKTKCTVFGQGFLRGIAAMKGGGI